MMNALPIDIQREILSYVSHVDGLEYARSNKSLCRELMAELRMIIIRKEDYLTSESYRNKIRELIVDPYRQLALDFGSPIMVQSENRERIKLPESNQLVSKLVLRELSISIKDFTQLLPHLIQLHHLILIWESGDREHPIPQISGLKKLTLIQCPNSSLTVIPSLSIGAHLHHHLDLRSLQSVMLFNCPSISDVSCLSHIYELQLLFCSSLIDISCLNNNEIILVDLCPVRNYSECFRFSRVITVIIRKSGFDGNVPTTIKGINLERLEAVQSLTVYIEGMNITDPLLSNSERLPTSLHSLTIEGMTSLLRIPEHHNLKEIRLSRCENVSLQNLEKISLFSIHFCNQIIDWSPLQKNKNVELTCCNGFKSGKEFKDVKKLTLMTNRLDIMEDLTNITNLVLMKQSFNEAYITSSTQGKRLFSSANRLQEIILLIELTEEESEIAFLSWLIRSSQHKRIVLIPLTDMSSFETIYQLIMESFGTFYDVEMSKRSGEIILLKKDEKQKGKGFLFSSLIPISFGIISIFTLFMVHKTLIFRRIGWSR